MKYSPEAQRGFYNEKAGTDLSFTDGGHGEELLVLEKYLNRLKPKRVLNWSP